MPPDECGGDLDVGAGTPAETAARTPAETGALPCPGTAHDTTPLEHTKTTDVLWPLVVMLGDIAQRVTQRAREEQHNLE